jgi:hypothetical protein
MPPLPRYLEMVTVLGLQVKAYKKGCCSFRALA